MKIRWKWKIDWYFFRKGENEITEQLLKQLNKDGKIHVVPARVKESYIIRFTVTSYYTTEEDIKRDWCIIQSTAEKILKDEHLQKEEKKKFQSTLLLSNVPQTPKLVNASFLAFLDIESAYDILKELTKRDYARAHLPLKPRRKPKFFTDSSQKFLSFDQSSNSFANNPDENKTSTRKKVQNGNVEFPLLDDDDLENLNLDNLTLNGAGDEHMLSMSYPMPNLNGRRNYVKQSSLDSKIEHIFEEAHEAELNAINEDSNN